MSVKENILFGSTERSDYYEEVLEACALKTDLQILPAGDQTEIGENGVNLSGGQKQRVALARAAYRASEIYLFDDPLSAVDAHVAKHLFKNLIGPDGLLKDFTKIIATHNLSFLDKMDYILLLDEGKIILQGKYEVIKDNPLFLDFTKSTVNENKEEDMEEREVIVNIKDSKLDEADNIIKEEERQDGRVGLKNYIHYIKMVNVYIFLFIVSLFALGEGIMVLCNLVLTDWTNKASEEILSLEEHSKYILSYGGLNVLMCIVSVIYNVWIYFALTKPSRKMHDSIMNRTMHAPLTFFESNPSGRVLNRFTSDLEIIDRKIPFEVSDLVYCLVNLTFVCITVSTIIPYILIAVVPILGCFVLLQMLLTRTRCQIKRYESVAKTPIISHFSETISGSSTIRAFREMVRFENEFEKRMSKHLRANYINDMMNRWLSVRVDILGNVLIFLTSVLTFTLRNKLSPGLAGMAITYSMMIIDNLGWTVRMFCDLETDSVAIERIKEYETIEQEDDWELDNVPQDWPQTAELEVENVCAKYRENLPNCLKNLSLKLSPGEKLGVCGRTGAGKSSLASLLLRIIQPHEGLVKFGAINTLNVGLQQLRSKITIVPQVTISSCYLSVTILNCL